MKLYIESHLTGMYEVGAKLQVLTPEFIDAYIEYAKVFEKINFDPQVIADLVCKFSSTKELAQAMIVRYNVTKEQALLAILLPFHDTPLYFNKKEYYRQIERLKTLRRILQEVRDVKD